MLTVTLDAKAQPAIEPNPSFLFGKDSAGISTNIPAPTISPVIPSMLNFVSDTSGGGKSENRSALFESIRNFGKNMLKKVKQESKPKTQEKPITIEELQYLYQNDPKEQVEQVYNGFSI
ncbi:WH2 domain-containing protein [Candidatus Rickettsia kedanie]|uniref:WH2 domain-containing protein n=1 Tax=Candidatus Rickettsia kedanie TaxID=3115352 RepID=A0ABP9U0Y6_9RICK